MSSHSVPVLVSQWTENLHTALVLDGPASQSCATSSAEAFDQVRSHLRKIARKGEGDQWPNIDRFELEKTTVKVRLYYREKNRQFPASRELRLHVRYVLGHYADDSVECFLPDFDVVFYCPSIRELDRLIDEQVRSCTAHMTSEQLSAATPPIESTIRLVRVRPQPPQDHLRVELPETLQSVASPMVQRLRKQKTIRAVDRSGLLKRLSDAMRQSSVLLVGPAGCGKSTLIRTVAHQLQEAAREDARQMGTTMPAPLVWQTSAEDVIAGMAYLGQWESRVEDLITDADSISATLAFRSLIDLVRLGGTGPADSIASFLDDYLQRGEAKLVAECTEEELLAVKRLLPGFVNHFQIVVCDVLAKDQVAGICKKMLDEASRNHRIEVDDASSDLIANLMQRLLPYEAPPRGAVELTRELIETQSVIGVNEVITAVTRRTGLPEMILRDSQTMTLDQVRNSLGDSVIGQTNAVDVAAGVVLRVKAGLCDPQRPIATLLFTGPTGVGKTQLCRSLADYLFGNTMTNATSRDQNRTLIRLDMSEYSGYDGAHHFLNASDGDVADWIGQLRRRPMSVLLLDEFEKASPEVHDLLLSALDEGRLTDPLGRTTSLCGCVIVLTSNVGSKRVSSLGFAGEDEQSVRLEFDRAVRQAFRLEFINRLDEVVTFSPLDRKTTRQIVIKELRSLSQREAMQRNRVRLSWTDRCVDQLAEIGFDPQMGARPLQRVIEQRIVSKIARQILNHEGDDALEIELDHL